MCDSIYTDKVSKWKQSGQWSSASWKVGITREDRFQDKVSYFPLQNLPNNAAYSSSSMKQLVSVNTWVRVSAAAVFNQCNANSDSCGHWRTVLFLDAAAAEHLEENCMACPGWLARHDYSAPWSSARCSSTLTQVCLEYPAAGAVLRLRPEYRLCPGVGRDTKAPPALWTFSLRLERFGLGLLRSLDHNSHDVKVQSLFELESLVTVWLLVFKVWNLKLN